MIYVKYIIDGKDDELQIRGQTSSANSQKIGDPGGKKDIIAELLPTIDYSDDEIIFYLLYKISLIFSSGPPMDGLCQTCK